MDNTERARAEKILIRYGNSIDIRDYGLALAITHNIIKQIEGEHNVVQQFCECVCPNMDSSDTFSTCRRCHLPIKKWGFK